MDKGKNIFLTLQHSNYKPRLATLGITEDFHIWRRSKSLFKHLKQVKLECNNCSYCSLAGHRWIEVAKDTPGFWCSRHRKNISTELKKSCNYKPMSQMKLFSDLI